MAEAPLGMVVAVQANYCWVELDRPGPGGRQRLLCTRRTRLAKAGQAICVGDRVELEGVDWTAARGAVGSLQPRQALLSRPTVANLTRVVVVTSLIEPALDPDQLSRFLITAEATGQSVHLVLSKADRIAAEPLERWRQRLRGWGYEPLVTSSCTGLGLEALREVLSVPGIAVLCGPSGAGKSSLLNALCPQLALRVGAVSGRLQRGRHTTRHVELFALAPGALLADTPGFNRPQLPPSVEALAPLFPEVRQRLAHAACRYSNCLHQGEPGCGVGSDWDRHSLYRRCLAELQLEQAATGDRPDPPPPRFRRQSSRRRQRQGLSPPGLADSDLL